MVSEALHLKHWWSSGWLCGNLLTVSKSMDVNLKRRRKKGGTFMVLRLCEGGMGQCGRLPEAIR